MRIQKVENRPSFKGGVNNLGLKSLEKISEHGASFVAGVSFLSAAFLRPFAISLAPKTDKENKNYAKSNSLASGAVKFLMAEGLAVPVENAIKSIEKNPEKFLEKNTVEKFTDGADKLINSNNYKFAKNLITQSTSLITAIPKSYLTIALIPFVMDNLFNKKEETKTRTLIKQEYNPVFQRVYDKTSFKGNLFQKGVSGIFNNPIFQNFSNKFKNKSADVTRNTAIATDILLSASFAHQTKKSKKIEEKRKMPLIYNNIISTGVSIIGGFSLDKAIQKNTKEKLLQFAKKHKNDPKLSKYMDGINILRPTVIFALIYYGILPIITTSIADKADKFSNKRNNIP